MDKWQAQYNFWSQFGIPAYEENSVPDYRDLTFPYIAYEAASGSFEDTVSITASIWDNTKSFARIDPIADQIERFIRKMGCPEIDGGRYRVWTNPEFAQNMGDPDNDLLKRKVLNVNFEFMTEE